MLFTSNSTVCLHISSTISCSFVGYSSYTMDKYTIIPTGTSSLVLNKWTLFWFISRFTPSTCSNICYPAWVNHMNFFFHVWVFIKLSRPEGTPKTATAIYLYSKFLLWELPKRQKPAHLRQTKSAFATKLLFSFEKTVNVSK